MVTSPSENWCVLPTPMGGFVMYDMGDEGVRLLALGDLADQGPSPLLRIHSSCLAAEVFGATDCDCADQLRESMRLIAEEGRGLIVHLQQEGRGHGLARKIAAVGLMQRNGLDTFEAFEAMGLRQDVRQYDSVAAILQSLGLGSVRLITNNPAKESELRQHGFDVQVVRTHPVVRPENIEYLRTKSSKLRHALSIEPLSNETGAIRFYHSDQTYGVLSNYSAHAVFLGSRVWPTAEHYYQAQKFAGSEREEQIRACRTATLAKHLAGRWQLHVRQDWETAKEAVMFEVLRAKFTQHPDLGCMLVETGDRELIEHTASDAYWGDAGDGSGENRLGLLLMRVRFELRGQNSGVDGVV